MATKIFTLLLHQAETCYHSWNRPREKESEGKATAKNDLARTRRPGQEDKMIHHDIYPIDMRTGMTYFLQNKMGGYLHYITVEFGKYTIFLC